MTDLILLQKDLGYTEKKLDELVSDFKARQPAEKTQDFITEVKLTMKGQSDKLDTLVKTLDVHIEDQKTHEAKLQVKLEEYQGAIFGKLDEAQRTMTTFIDSNDGRLGRLENWKSWVIGIFSVIGIIMALVAYIYINDIGNIKSELQHHIDQTQNLIK